MKKGKIARFAGFAGALGLTTVLVTTAVQATGAYFTDSVNGSLHGSSGSLQITAGDTSINFSGLNPGEDRTQTVTFTNKASSTTDADIWLVFDQDSKPYGKFTGAKDVSYAGFTGGGMGQYGHFKVVGEHSNLSFESYNLQLPDQSDATGGYHSKTNRNTCSVDKYGHGGSSVQHKIGNENDIAECGVPAAILLWTDLTPGKAGHAKITFGLTGKQTQQNQPNDPKVPFQIVATQPGISPDFQW